MSRPRPRNLIRFLRWVRLIGNACTGRYKTGLTIFGKRPESPRDAPTNSGAGLSTNISPKGLRRFGSGKGHPDGRENEHWYQACRDLERAGLLKKKPGKS